MSEDEQLEFLRRQRKQLLQLVTLHERGPAVRELLALIPSLQARIDLLVEARSTHR